MNTVRVHYEVGQTALAIVCDPAYLDTVRGAVHSARSILESKISEDPFFGTTFEPYPPSKDDDHLIQRMCQASALADVGPMAGVAAAVSVYVTEEAVSKGCRHIIVENGGDIALLSKEPAAIGIFADHPVLTDMAFLMGSDHITGVCSSSRTVGPSVSLGNSSISTVFSDDVILADCCATALGNLVKDEDSLQGSVERIGSIEGVKGCMACCGDKVAIFGEIPEIVPADCSHISPYESE